MAITADIDETDRAGIALCANQVPGSSARSRLPWAGGSRCSCASRGGNQGHRSLTDLASCLRARKGALCRPVPTPITPKYATCSPHLGVRYPSRKQMVSPEAETPAVRRPGPGHRRPLHRHPSALQRWQRSAGRSRLRHKRLAVNNAAPHAGPRGRLRRDARLIRHGSPSRNPSRWSWSVAVRGKPTVHTDRPGGRTPPAICPWTPRHGDLQRYKVTHDGTEKKRPASTRIRR